MTAPPGHLRPVTPPPPPRNRRGGTVARFVLAVLFTLAAVIAALPDLLGLDRRTPFAQLTAFRPWILVAGGTVVLILGLATIRWRRLWPFAAGGLAVLLVGGSLVLPRVLAEPAPAGGRALTVLAFNTYLGDADVAQTAALIADRRPQLVSLSESGADFAGRLAPLVEPLGYRLHTSTPPGRDDVAGVTALVAGSLGAVEVDFGEGTPFRFVEVTGGSLGELRFVAFHSVAPVQGSVAQWGADLAKLANWCGRPGQAIVAGDLNATLDHSALRAGMAGCGDAADQRGAGLIPTWGPTPRTRLIGPQIDHVLATAGIVAETFEVHDVAGSDHRAIVTTLRLP